MNESIPEEKIRRAVRDRYTSLAQSARGQRSSCCDPPDAADLSERSPMSEGLQRLGYRPEELASLPPAVQEVAAGCGAPTALANLQPGQVVVDLGSGGGIDVLLAAKAVGPTGRAIGVDATPEMVWRAREGARDVPNAEFRLGEIEHLPLESGSADVVLSNCVINLAPDKGAVFREAFRVLRPGGTLAVSDIVYDGEGPVQWPDLLRNWAACIAGAIPKAAYLEAIRRAGFDEPEIVRETSFVPDEVKPFLGQLAAQAPSPADRAKAAFELGRLLPRMASVELRARKPGPAR